MANWNSQKEITDEALQPQLKTFQLAVIEYHALLNRLLARLLQQLAANRADLTTPEFRQRIRQLPDDRLTPEKNSRGRFDKEDAWVFFFRLGEYGFRNTVTGVIVQAALQPGEASGDDVVPLSPFPILNYLQSSVATRPELKPLVALLGNSTNNVYKALERLRPLGVLPVAISNGANHPTTAAQPLPDEPATQLLPEPTTPPLPDEPAVQLLPEPTTPPVGVPPLELGDEPEATTDPFAQSEAEPAATPIAMLPLERREHEEFDNDATVEPGFESMGALERPGPLEPLVSRSSPDAATETVPAARAEEAGSEDAARKVQHRRGFSGPNLLQIAMPVGGIGAGCLCLNGHGGFQDFAFRHKPATTATPDNWNFQQAVFALLHVTGDHGRLPVTRLVEGPLPIEKVYDQSLQAQGYRKGGHEGLPRFTQNDFVAEYPFGHARLRDPHMPLAVIVTGWSPFVPRDDRVSSMPVAIVEYTLENASTAPVTYELSFHASHPAVGAGGWQGTCTAPFWPSTQSTLDAGDNPGWATGVIFANTEPVNSETQGTAVIASLGARPSALKTAWLRGGWFDAVSALWREVSTGSFVARPNAGDTPRDGLNGGSLLLTGTLAPGESITHPFAISWHFPNCNQTYGAVGLTPPSDPCAPPLWRPYYAGEWADAGAVMHEVAADYQSLRARTRAFADALHTSTLPDAVVDAVASNLAILKSPTILRQENGNLWAWEGCFTDRGSCHGSCTHVWNYAQALPHLFPALERTLREQEFCRSMDDTGHVNFRSALPDGPTTHDFHAAADGQLGGILKLYREWSICGDSAWLSRLYPLAKRSLEYCILKWDPDLRGALFEPHHNTYDIEFWGPDPMCTTIYIAALSAMALLAVVFDNQDAAYDVGRYNALAERGARYLDRELSNGEYLVQRVQWEGLRDRSIAAYLSAGPQADDDAYTLLKTEGPRYQYGGGCLSDGVIGEWMAALYGVPTPTTADTIRQHLAAIRRYNFRTNLSQHACTQRPGYAIGKEPGLLLCTWPNGKKPTLPFVYSDEVWTGIEYQVASHLILEGMVEEGLDIVAATRSRYDGHARNPFNEYECGSYYARALSSFALVPALAGFRYHAPTASLTFGPQLATRPFRTFFSTECAWGIATLNDVGLAIEVMEGALPIRSVHTLDATNTAISLAFDTPQVVTPTTAFRYAFPVAISSGAN